MDENEEKLDARVRTGDPQLHPCISCRGHFLKRKIARGSRGGPARSGASRKERAARPTRDRSSWASGNPLRGDDGAGRLLAERWVGLPAGRVRVPDARRRGRLDPRKRGGAAARDRRRRGASGAPPGTIRRFDATAGAAARDLRNGLDATASGCPEAIANCGPGARRPARAADRLRRRRRRLRDGRKNLAGDRAGDRVIDEADRRRFGRSIDYEHGNFRKLYRGGTRCMNPR